jgi:hypothetical protein
MKMAQVRNQSLKISKDGVVIESLASKKGVMSANSTGKLDMRQVVNDDIADNANISDKKLGTISEPGKVSNSALPTDLTGHKYDGVSFQTTTNGFSMIGSKKKVSFASSMTLLGKEGAILDIGSGGVLSDGTNADNIVSGTISNERLPVALEGHTYNDVNIEAFTTGFGIAGGTGASKQLTVLNDIILEGPDGSSVATLDPATNRLYPSQLPLTAIPMVLGVVDSQLHMTTIGTPPNGLPLGHQGDLCIRSDSSTTWFLNGNDQTNFSDWEELATPPQFITSVAGRIGDIVLSATDISGLAPSATTDTTNGSNITTGTISNARTTATSTNTANAIVARDASDNFSAGTITASLNGNASTATNFLGSLNGDVTGNQGTTVVASVGGQSASNVANTVSAVASATSTNVINTLVKRDGSGNASFNNVIASLIGSASNNVLKTGDTMNGTLVLPAGTTTIPSLTFTGSTTSGLSIISNVMHFITNSLSRANFNASGTFQISGLNVVGILRNDVNGNISSALITDADISSSASINDSKLAIIVSSGKVANSATTATSVNVALAIASRDSNGDCSFRIITGTLNGNATTATSATTATFATTAGSATSFTGSLVGDITGTQSSTVVSLVGGQSASNVASATASVLSATANNTANTLVKRDNSSNASFNMITLGGTTTNPTDVATKAYVDLASSLGVKPIGNAIVVSSSNVSLTGLQTIDSVVLLDTNRVLLINQSSSVENGVWLAHSGSWTRPTDFNTGSTADRSFVLILQGTINAGASWLCNTPFAIIDTDPITFTQLSLPDTTAGVNVGSGSGQVFRDKVGKFINFKTINAGSHIVIANNADDITLSTDATSANINSTIVARDGSGTFAGSLTGSASNNVLKAGDAMVGNLLMSTESVVRFGDAGSNYVGLKAPTSVSSSYTMNLPTSSPAVNNKLIVDPVDATQLIWSSGLLGTTPTTSRVIAVSVIGNDTNGNGSLDFPYRSLSKALIIANSLSSITTPITIMIYPGIYVEDNSVGALALTANGITILGSGCIATIIKPNTLANGLLTITASSWFQNIQFASGGISTADGMTISGASAQVIFLNVNVTDFNVGIRGTSVLNLILSDSFFTANNTAIYLSNVASSINDCIIKGTGTSIGLYSTGSSSNNGLAGNSFVSHGTAVSVNNNSSVSINSIIFKANAIGCSIATAGSMIIVSSEFVQNNTSGNVIGVLASDVGTFVRCVASVFRNPSAPVNNQIAFKVIGQATCTISGGSISNFTTGFVVGDITDTSATSLRFNAITCINCTNDIIQNGTTSLIVQNSNIDSSKIIINDPTNTTFSYFDASNDDALTIGNFSNSDSQLLRVEIGGTAVNPQLRYIASLYSSQSIGYNNLSTNASLFSSTGAGDNGFLSMTSDRTKQTSLQLISDEAGVRGWTIAKNQSTSELRFDYQNADIVGQIAIADYTLMQLDGFNNQVQFPDTGTKIVIAGLTANRALITNSSKQLVSSATTDTEIGYLSGVSSAIQTQIDNITTGTQAVNRGGTGQTSYIDGQLLIGDSVGNTLVKATLSSSDGSVTITNGNGSISLTISASNIASGTLADARIANALTGKTINGLTLTALAIGSSIAGGTTSKTLTFTATLTLTGTDGSTLNIGAGGSLVASAFTDTTNANNISAGTLSNARTTATNANTASAIVSRDVSGNFSAGTITASLSGNATTATTATTATNFSGSLVGDVTGTQSATVVSSVGGQSASNVASATSTTLTGILSVVRGGTGQSTFNNGEVMIGNGSGNTLTKSTLTAGTNITIVNGTGSITINSASLYAIYQPGGTADTSKSIFTNWSSMITFLIGQSTNGSATIFFDSSFGANYTIDIPAGTYTLPKECNFVGLATPLSRVLSPDIYSAVNLTNTGGDVVFNSSLTHLTIKNIGFNLVNTTNPNFSNLSSLDLLGYSSLQSNGNTQPMFSYTNFAANIDLSGSSAIITNGSLGVLIHTDGLKSLIITLEDQTAIWTGLITTGVQASLNIGKNASCFVDPTYNSIATVTNAGNAVNIALATTTPTDWTTKWGFASAPTTVDEALNNLISEATVKVPVSHGGTGTTTAFTPGSVVFATTSGVYSQNNAKLFWDITNARLGIGTTTPGFPLEVRIDQTAETAAGVANITNSSSAIAAFYLSAGPSPFSRFKMWITGTSTDSNLYNQKNGALNFGTNNTLRMVITALGSMQLGAGAVTTTATDGFPYIPTCAGTPTGIPTSLTGMGAIVLDTTNNVLYFYNSGWKNAFGGTDGVLAINLGGTNSSASLGNGKIMVSSGGAIVEGTSSSTPTFTSGTFTATTNQFTLGTTNTVIITAPAPTSSTTITIPDPGQSTSNFMLTDNTLTQVVNSPKLMKSVFCNSATYTTGTASQSTTTITGSGTTFTSAMQGGVIVFANGTRAFITTFVSVTDLTTAQSQTVSGQAYTIYYGGFQASDSNNVSINTAYMPGLTASLPLQLDSNKQVVSSAVSLTTGVSGTLPVANGGTNAGAFTQGSIPFIGASGTYTQNNAKLFFDNTNIALCVGVNVARAQIDNGKSGGATLMVRDTNGTNGVIRLNNASGLNLIESGTGIDDGSIAQLNIQNMGGGPVTNWITCRTDGTVTIANSANTSGAKFEVHGTIGMTGATSGSMILAVPAVAGTNTITFPAGTTNFSSTGGTGQVVKQTSAGGAFTVALVVLTTDVSGVLPVANGGTNASSASITAFNNITGYTASGATGTTSTNLVFSTSPTITTPVINGVTDASAAASGVVGQVISATVATGSAVSLTSPNAANVTSISLTAGDWDVYGTVAFKPNTTMTVAIASINTTSATVAAASTIAGSVNKLILAFTSGGEQILNAGSCQINVSSTTTVFLVAQATFSSTNTAYGSIWARRRR